jgi:hypothetical protein
MSEYNRLLAVCSLSYSATEDGRTISLAITERAYFFGNFIQIDAWEVTCLLLALKLQFTAFLLP